MNTLAFTSPKIGSVHERGSLIAQETDNKSELGTTLFENTSTAQKKNTKIEARPLQPQSIFSFDVPVVYPTPAPTPMCGNYPCYSSADFLEIYDLFEKESNSLDFLSKYVYNIAHVDEYIKSAAEKRGYQKRGFARESDLVWFENVQTRREVRDAYVSLRNEMAKENIRLHFVSGYRSSTAQRNIFKRKMNISNLHTVPTGIHDERIDNVLARSAIPGYSKHHSGYALDFGCGNDYLVFEFANTDCYKWMSENNFEKIKKYGFIPSYPDGVDFQGPNPEPWEYVWVGEETLLAQ